MRTDVVFEEDDDDDDGDNDDAVQELCGCQLSEGNCSCCKECMLCLGPLWEECCDCVGESLAPDNHPTKRTNCKRNLTIKPFGSLIATRPIHYKDSKFINVTFNFLSCGEIRHNHIRDTFTLLPIFYSNVFTI